MTKCMKDTIITFDDSNTEKTTGEQEIDDYTPLQQELIKKLVSELGYSLSDAVDAVLSVVDATQEADDSPGAFKADSRDAIEWVLKKLARAQKEIDTIDTSIASEVAAIQRRGDQLKAKALRTKSFFEQVYLLDMESWTREALAGSKEKSVPLIYGRVGFKKAQDKVMVFDETQCIAIAKTVCPGAIKTVESVLKIALKPYLAESSESSVQFKGVAAIEVGENKFYIEAALPE